MRKLIVTGTIVMSVVFAACSDVPDHELPVETTGPHSTVSGVGISVVVDPEQAGLSDQSSQAEPSQAEEAHVGTESTVPQPAADTTTTTVGVTVPEELATEPSPLPEPGSGLVHPKTPNTTKVVPPPQD
jgi:hypothetical protein